MKELPFGKSGGKFFYALFVARCFEKSWATP